MNEINNNMNTDLSSYSPGLTVENWIELIKNKDVFNDDSINVMQCMIANNGRGTCKELANKYGQNLNYYITQSTGLAKRVLKTTGCELPPDVKYAKLWPVLYLGRKAEKDQEGVFEWELRPELSEALNKVGIPPLQNILQNEKETEKMNKTESDISLNTILYGPPGTGKTYQTVYYAVDIIEQKVIKDPKKDVFQRYQEYKKQDWIEFTTFHQSFGYEEFIEGIRPKIVYKKGEDESTDVQGEGGNESSDVQYEIKSGVFKEFCKKALKNGDKNYVFIIDEINRGNIANIFGELITLIEPSRRVKARSDVNDTEEASEPTYAKLPYSGDNFGVPDNVYILGTMNTADRSITQLDTALRRRFDFVEMMPKPEKLQEIMNKEGGVTINVHEMLKTINQRIEALYDREHMIGHAFFIKELKKSPTVETLGRIFKKKIIPLLQEYFFDDYEKIRLVLGDSSETNINHQFIKCDAKKKEDLFPGVTSMDDVEIKPIYHKNEDALKNPQAYRKIYPPKPGSEEAASNQPESGTDDSSENTNTVN